MTAALECIDESSSRRILPVPAPAVCCCSDLLLLSSLRHCNMAVLAFPCIQGGEECCLCSPKLCFSTEGSRVCTSPSAIPIRGVCAHPTAVTCSMKASNIDRQCQTISACWDLPPCIKGCLPLINKDLALWTLQLCRQEMCCKKGTLLDHYNFNNLPFSLLFFENK